MTKVRQLGGSSLKRYVVVILWVTSIFKRKRDVFGRRESRLFIYNPLGHHHLPAGQPTEASHSRGLISLELSAISVNCAIYICEKARRKISVVNYNRQQHNRSAGQ